MGKIINSCVLMFLESRVFGVACEGSAECWLNGRLMEYFCAVFGGTLFEVFAWLLFSLCSVFIFLTEGRSDGGR